MSDTTPSEQQRNDEFAFLEHLDQLGVPLFLAEPGGIRDVVPALDNDGQLVDGELVEVILRQPADPEFVRPNGWQKLTAEANDERLQKFRAHVAICALCGLIAVVDVDPRNGGDIKKVRALLAELGVRIFAEITTPSRGKHFYVAGRPDLPSTSFKDGDWVGVDIQSHGRNVFLPLSERSVKYPGKFYQVVFDDLDALADEGDPLGAEALSQWVGEQLVVEVKARAGKDKDLSAYFELPAAPPWPKDQKPDARQQAYLDAVLNNAVKDVSGATLRNDALFFAAMKCASFGAGAGMDQTAVFLRLNEAAQKCGLTGDDGQASVWATIKSGFKVGQANPRAVPDKDHADFWEKTDTLRHIRNCARARRVGPWGVLGVSMALVAATVPPTVQLPPLVGGNASLNVFLGLVAESGYGKGVLERAAEVAFRLGPIYTTGIGSGEGINHLFAHYDKASDATVMDRKSVLFSVPEIDTLAALGNRNGTTLLSQLRKAWSGEALTFSYVDRTKALVIEEHAYRLSLVVGIQPGRARVLLEDSDGGTPQRFVWLPTHDLDAPDEVPPMPDPIDLRGIASGWPGSDLRANLVAAANGQVTTHVLTLPPEAQKAIDDNARAKLRRESTDSALDGHLGLCRIKVAAALALLHNQREITVQMWDLAGVVMAMSQETRAGIERHLADQWDKANRARGKAEGVRAAISEEVRTDANIQKACRTIMRILGKDEHKGEMAWNDLYRDARRDRDYLESAVEQLVAAGQVEDIKGENSRTIRLVVK
jgi:Protein of unknown function (DUF3987)/Bifunctional DNA primase/polymerase, N-terminal